MKRPALRVAGLIVLGAVIVGAGALAWYTRERRLIFYTDADTIREPAGSAPVREILWQPAMPVPGPINSADQEYEPRVSADGQTLYFVRGKAGHNADIYFSARTSDGWEEPRPLTAVNSPADDLGPEPSTDGRSLYLYSDRPGGLGGYDLWVARRDEQNNWQAPVNLGPGVNSPFNDYGPALTPDGTTLYFSSNRPRPGEAAPNADTWPATLREDLTRRDYDLYTAPLTPDGPGQAQPLIAFNTPFNEGAPAVSPFGDFLYFASDRPGGMGGFDLYRSRRLHGGHEPPVNLGAAINTAANELDPALSLGGYAINFSSDRAIGPPVPDRPADYNLYQSTSREVFRETQTARATVDWARLRPLLWLLLLLLALLLLVLALRRLTDSDRFHRLSLLAKCLLASMLVHAMILFALAFWRVGAAMEGLLHRAGGGGGTKVTLAGPQGGDGLAIQLRSGLTDITISPAPDASGARSMPAPVTSGAAPATLLSVAPSVLSIDARSAVASPVPTDAPTPGAQAAEPAAAVDAPTLDPVRVALPAPANPAAAPAERTFSVADMHLAPADAQRPARPPGAIPSATAASAIARLAPSQTAPPNLTLDSSIAGAASARDADAPPASIPQPSTAPPQASAALSSDPVRVALPASARPSGQAERTLSAADVALGAPSAAGTPRPPVPGGSSGVPPSAVALVPSSSNLGDPSADPSIWAAGLARDAQAPASAPSASSTGAPGSVGAPPVDVAQRDVSLPASHAAAPGATGTGEAEAALPLPTGTPGASPRPPIPGATGAPSAAAMLAPADSTPALALGAPSATLIAPTGPGTDAPVAGHGAPTSAGSSDLAAAVPDLTPRLGLPTETAPPENPYRQRAADLRQGLVERLGGSQETEHAVALALDWLSRHQSPDGRWDSRGFDKGCRACGGQSNIKSDVALTGLSLLAFLGADHTHVKDGPYRDAVARALRWLVDQQAASGDLRAGETMYSHGIATIVLCEAYGMTHATELRAPAARAIAFLVAARASDGDGGWRYAPGQDGDTSVLGWQVMALASGRRAGIGAPDDAFAGARDWLARAVAPGKPGLYPYQPGLPVTPTMTAEALFAQQLLGQPHDDPATGAAVDYVLAHPPDWKAQPSTYYWYYGTLALFQHRGQAWDRWNAALKRQLLAHQRAGGAPAGSWDPADKYSKIGGRVYQTAICTLSLEVYYRYLPMYAGEQP